MNKLKFDKTTFQELCAKKAAGNITPEEMKQLEELTKHDPALQKTEQVLQQTSIGFGPKNAEQLAKAKAETWTEIESRMSKRENVRSLYRRMVRIAASAAAVLVVGVVAMFLFRGTTEMIVVVNDDTEVREVLLQDSTRVWLQLSAEISYPEKFTRRRRPVRLTGEAFFDVARDASRPFTVSTASAEVKVLGTRFNVKTATGGGVTEVMLESGSVALNVAGKDDGTVTIKPGELAIADLSNASISVSETDPYMYSIWKEKELVFRAQRLGDIMMMLEKAYGVDIRLVNETLGKTEYTGKFKKTLPIEEVLAIIEMNTSMVYRINDDGSIDIR